MRTLQGTAFAAPATQRQEPTMNPLFPTVMRSTLWPLAAAVVLQACGGGDSARPLSAAEAPLAERRSAFESISPLLDENGNPMPSVPDAEPDDPGAQTRSRRYATAAQAEQLLHVMGARAVRIDAGCCGADAVDVAVHVVRGVRAIEDLDADAPVMVHGTDQRLAATLANRLDEEGMKRVWLVTH